MKFGDNTYMKKLLYFFSFLLLLTAGDAYAITQSQINAEVQIVCPDAYGNWTSGSGTMIDPKGIVLTNRHVITDQYGGTIKTCFIGFVRSISQEPDFGTQANPNLAEIKYHTTSDDMDAAILYLNNPTNKKYDYVDIWNSDSDSLIFGDKIEAVGYPSIGGSTITYTSGDFSGYGSRLDGTHNYLKASVPLEHGNSGGAAYSGVKGFIGIPTAVIAGELNSISYILSVNSIKQWLLSILGESPSSSLSQQQAEAIQPQKILQEDVTPPIFQSDYYIITFHSNDRNVDFHWNLNDDDSDITINWLTAYDAAGVDGYYVYFGTDPLANPITDGTYVKSTSFRKVLTLAGIYYAKVAPRDINGNVGNVAMGTYNYQVYDDWLINDPMHYKLVTNRPVYFKLYDYSSGNKGDLLKTVKLDSSRSQTINVPSNNVLIKWDGADDKNFITGQAVRLETTSSMQECKNESSYSERDACLANSDSTDPMRCADASTDSPWSDCLDGQMTQVSKNQYIKTGLSVNTPYVFQFVWVRNY